MKNKYFRLFINLFSPKKTIIRKNIEVKRGNSLYSTYLKRNVHLDIFLPPSYFSDSFKPYPLLLVNDGQDMEAIQMEQTLNILYKGNVIKDIIVVAIHAADRMQEYGTSQQADYNMRGSKAGAYTSFILTEIMPYLHQEYRCTPNSTQNAFAGFSLGGLSAIDIVWNHPDFFGKAGVFSGALWWRSKDFIPEDPDANRIIHDMVNQDKKKKGLKFWFQTGTKDEISDRNNNGIIDAIDDTLDLIKILTKLGYKQDRDIEYIEVVDGIHHPSTWLKVMPDFLIWAFRK